MISPRAAVTGLAFVAYVVLAHSVHNLYPFSTFAMFAGGDAPRASRVIARDLAGQPHEISGLVSWRCDGPVRIEHDACSGVYSQIDYQDRAAVDWIDAHPGSDGKTAIEVVRRIWRLDGGSGPPPFEDCLLARCRATTTRP